MGKHKFNEPEILKELENYIDATYSQHYAKGIQVVEFIMSHLETPDFFRGNVLKYIARYGKKEGYNRKDLMKAMHYLVMMIYFHDQKFEPKVETIDMGDQNLIVSAPNTNFKIFFAPKDRK